MADSYVGTSGWMYRHWRGPFYPCDLPQAQWFRYYSARLSTVEVNNTFYRLPKSETFAAWRQEAPPGFRYAVKASRYITHLKKLLDAGEPLERFLSRARELAGALGPILYQLPPHWHEDLGRLAAFLELLPGDLWHVFEFRHPSWYTPETLALLDEHGAGFCVQDLPGLETPVCATGKLAYVRLHGPTRPYVGSYSDEELRAWAQRIEAFLSSGRPAYIYFNNDAQGYAVRNALRLQEMLGREVKAKVAGAASL